MGHVTLHMTDNIIEIANLYYLFFLLFILVAIFDDKLIGRQS